MQFFIKTLAYILLQLLVFKIVKQQTFPFEKDLRSRK